MDFAYKSINTKAPSMSAYSGNVVEFNYHDTKVDNVELLNAVSTEVDNLNIDNNKENIVNYVSKKYK